MIPAQEANALRLKEFEERALNQWVDELPTANPALATRLLLDFLTRFNGLEMPFQLRLDSLEILRPSMLIIEDYLRSKLISIGFPKDEEDSKYLAILVLIEKEFTIGYWIVLKELTRRSLSWFQGKNAALAIQRCIKGLGSIVVSHMTMGMPMPDWVWIDIHSLYRLSIKIGKDTASVSNEPNNPVKTSSPEESYQQIVLLSLAEPTGLLQKEIQLVYDFIGTLGAVLDLKQNPVTGQSKQCVILGDEDRPAYFEHAGTPKSDPAKLYIDLTKLFKALKNRDKLANKAETRFNSVHVLKSKTLKPSIELLDYLEKRWQGIELQSTPFFKDRLDRYVAIGFESTYKLQTTPDLVLKQDYEFLAQSESDRALSCVFTRAGVLSVGSLISFRRTDVPEYKRCLGIVNEVVVAKQQNGKISFGVQVLAKQSVAVTYTLLEAPGYASSQRALLYSTKEGEVEKSYMITDTNILNENDIIRMLMGNEVFPVALNTKKNIGLGYWQFECRRIMDMSKLAQAR